MAYTTDATERNKLHKAWIDEENRPCAYCGAVDVPREIHRKTPGHMGGTYTPENCEVACFPCHRGQHPNSKFRVGDRVCINGRTTEYITLTRHTPRRVVAIEYSASRECNYYILGSNGKGECNDGQPLEGIQFYRFRSYMLVRYTPRQYGRRRYRMKPDDARLTASSNRRQQKPNTAGH